jgi:hypothetical protein
VRAPGACGQGRFHRRPRPQPVVGKPAPRQSLAARSTSGPACRRVLDEGRPTTRQGRRRCPLRTYLVIVPTARARCIPRAPPAGSSFSSRDAAGADSLPGKPPEVRGRPEQALNGGWAFALSSGSARRRVKGGAYRLRPTDCWSAGALDLTSIMSPTPAQPERHFHDQPIRDGDHRAPQHVREAVACLTASFTFLPRTA